MFQLVLIRHAQSANNALGEKLRVPDPSITDIGKQQAKRLADWLQQYPPTHLYCSGFRRAIETSKPIAEQLNLPAFVRHDLYEQGGCYEGYLPGKMKSSPGMGRATIAELCPDWMIDDRISDLGWYCDRDLETDEEAVLRAQSVSQWIRSELIGAWQNQKTLHRIAMVIHADFKALLLRELLRNQDGSDGVPAEHNLYQIWNTSVTQLTWNAPSWRIDFWNSIRHLDPDLLTM